MGQGFLERDISFLGEDTPNPRSLAWYDRDHVPRLSADGRLVLFSSWGTRVEHVALLRNTSGAPPRILDKGTGLDLSPDGKWALLGSEEEGGLTLVPTGTGRPRKVALPGLEIRSVRFLQSPGRAVSLARLSADPGLRLYAIDLDRSISTPLSEVIKDVDGHVLEISPDGQAAAIKMTVDEKFGPALFPLSGGKPEMLTELGPHPYPVGWASKDELWLARVDADLSIIKLIRFDIRRHVTVQAKTIGTGGAEFTGGLHLTPDGKNIVFGQQRIAGHLYVARGLLPQ